eukprot:3527500-Rhodomonas_salina.1
MRIVGPCNTSATSVSLTESQVHIEARDLLPLCACIPGRPGASTMEPAACPLDVYCPGEVVSGQWGVQLSQTQHTPSFAVAPSSTRVKASVCYKILKRGRRNG